MKGCFNEESEELIRKGRFIDYTAIADKQHIERIKRSVQPVTYDDFEKIKDFLNEKLKYNKSLKGEIYMRFKAVTIKQCEICSCESTIGFREGVTEDIGIGSLHGSREFCEKCFMENTYTNEFGFTFLKYKDLLFCYKPYHYLDFGFREVISERDINRAFNPDRYEFEKWLSEY